MWYPTNPDKTPRILLPCPGNDHTDIEPGMIGIKDESNNGATYVRPFRDSEGDPEPDPIRLATVDDVSAVEHGDLAGDNNSDAEYQHYNSTPAAGEYAINIADAITGNPDAAVVQRATESIFNTTIAIGDSPATGGVVDGDVAIFNEGFATDALVKVDINTGRVIDSYVPASFTGARAITVVGRKLCIVDSSYIHEVPIDSFDSRDQIGATGLDGSIGRCAATGPNGDIYSASSTDPDAIYISVRGSTSYTVTKHTLDGIIGDISGICFDSTFTYFYISDTGYVRKYDVATRTLQTSSPTFSGVLCYGIFEILDDGNLVGCFSGTIKIFDTSDMSIKHTDALALISEDIGTVVGGTVIGLSSTSFTRYQLPGLTAAQPAHIDAGGALSSIFKSGNMRQTHHDWMRATANVTQLDVTRLGVDVISAVQSTDSEIVNATRGQRYLVQEATSTYPLHNHVFEMRSDGPHWYIPSGTVFERERGIYHDWVDGQWVPRTDTVIRGTVTIPSGTAIGTWTSSHIQFNNGSPMMLNTDDLHMLKCDYKILSRYGTGRSFLHRSNRVDIAPEYQVSSYADDVDHGGIQGATAASSYVNIDAETTPDKSGIIYAELVIEIPILTTADIELNYDIRLKGTIFHDAGTYDC